MSDTTLIMVTLGSTPGRQSRQSDEGGEEQTHAVDCALQEIACSLQTDPGSPG